MAKAKKEKKETGGKVKKLLPVEIDDKAKRAKEAEIRELLSANVDLKEKAKPFNDKRKQNTERIEKLRSEAESLTEEREVPCEVIYDFEHRTVKYKRLDTKKLVPELERTMEDSDRQEDLPIDGKRGRAPKGGIVAGKAGAKLRLSNPVLTPGEAVAAARAEKPRKTKPAPEVPGLAAAQAAHAKHYEDSAEEAEGSA